MNWLQLSIYTTSEGIDPVCGRLYQLGITGTEIEDYDDFKDFLENNKQYWDYVDEELIEQKKGETRVKVYISDNASGHEMLLQIKETILQLKEYDEEKLFGRLEIETDTMSEEDWANNWKQYFHPIKIGERLLVKPEWEDIDSDDGRIVFAVNPGMTFGTGSHFTTQLCMEQLEKYVKDQDTMLDLGCGSGILSVISLMLGADHATAVDIDPNAVNIAYENADRNNVDRNKYRVLSGNILTDEKLCETIGDRKYDIVAANIVADVIIGLTPAAVNYMKDDGIFITSGIIADREEDVKEVLTDNGFVIDNIYRRGEWVCIVCGRK